MVAQGQQSGLEADMVGSWGIDRETQTWALEEAPYCSTEDRGSMRSSSAELPWLACATVARGCGPKDKAGRDTKCEEDAKTEAQNPQPPGKPAGRKKKYDCKFTPKLQ